MCGNDFLQFDSADYIELYSHCHPGVVIPKERWMSVASTFLEFDPADYIDHILYRSVSCQKKDGHCHMLLVKH